MNKFSKQISTIFVNEKYHPMEPDKKATIWHWSHYLNHRWSSSVMSQGHFADNSLKSIFLNEDAWILIKILWKFVPKGPIDNKSALIRAMAWHKTGNKPLLEPIINSVQWCIYMHRPVSMNEMTQTWRLECQWLGQGYVIAPQNNVMMQLLIHSLHIYRLSWL